MSEPGMTRPVGWNWTISMSRSSRPARQARARPSADLSAEQAITLYIVGPPPIASSVARPPTATSSPRRTSSTRDGPALLEHADVRTRPDLLAETVHDLDAGEIAAMDRAVVALPRERLLVDAAVRRTVEEAAVARLQLQHATGRLAHERPHELLIVDPAPALEGVAQVGLERIGRGEDGVVAALDHARAARAPQEPLDDDGDSQRR